MAVDALRLDDGDVGLNAPSGESSFRMDQEDFLSEVLLASRSFRMAAMCFFSPL